MSKIFVKDREFYKTFLKLTLIIALQSLVSFAVNLADNVMLGRYDEIAMSGAALVNQVSYLLQSIIFGITTGGVVLSSQYWGRQELQPIRRITGISVKLSLIVGVLFFVAGRFFPAQTLRLLTNDPEVIAQGVEYLKILSYTYVIFAVSTSIVSSLRAVEVATIGTIMSVITLVINSSLNYVLIFGNFGAPELGVRGAAIATTASRIVELIVIFVYTFCIDKKLRARFGDIFGMDFGYMRDYVRVAIPCVASSGFWGVATVAQTAILGHLSATAIAANSIASVVFSVASVISMSSTSSSSVVMGKTVGEGRLDMVKPYTKTFQALFIIFGLITGGLLYVLRGIIIDFFAVSAETSRMADIFLTILSVSVVFSSYEYPLASGVVAGGGDTRYPFIVDTAAMLLFTLPFSALSAFVFKWPAVITFILMKSDQFLKCIPNAIKANSYNWIKILTREEKAE